MRILTTVAAAAAVALIFALPVQASSGDFNRCPEKCGAGVSQRHDGLNLTDAQKKKAREIFKNAKMEKEALLTDEQKAKMKEMRSPRPKNGKNGMRRGVDKRYAGLDLTDEQQAKIKAINEKARREKDSVLTDEQRAKMESLRKSRGSHRFGDNPAGEQERFHPGDHGRHHGHGPRHGHGDPFGVQLTDEQREKFMEIDRNARMQKEAILTDDQKARMREFHERRPHMEPDRRGENERRMRHGRHGMHGVNLTDEQKAKFKEIDERAQESFRKILTDEQKKSFDDMRVKRHRH